MYGPTVAGVHYPLFIEIAASGDNLWTIGVPFVGNPTGHDVILCFQTQAMADAYVQLNVNDGQCLQGEWAVISYPNDATGRAKVVATGVTHFGAVLVVHPLEA